MVMIDTSGWGEFYIGDIFSVSRPVARSQASYEEGAVPFVASGNYNNGVAKMCRPKDGEQLDQRGCITISPLDGSAFYQPVDFLGRGGAGSAILMLRNEHLSEYNGLYLATVLRAALTKFSYIDQINSKSIMGQSIILPVASDGSPDWGYMESYMREVFEEAEASLGGLNQADEEPVRVDVTTWRNVKIADLFDIVKGSRLTRADMVEGDTRYIGAVLFGNGITNHIANNENVHPAGTLTVVYNGAATAKTFYQDEPFWATDDINVLYPKFKMSLMTGLFLATVIERYGHDKYGWYDKWKLEYMKEDSICIPCTTDGSPDWDYMDTYMRAIMDEAGLSLGGLSGVVV